MVNLRREEDVFVLQLDGGENRFSPDLLQAIDGALDEVEGAGSPAALVTTGSGKFYTNGLDVDWMASHGGEVDGYLSRVLGVLERVLTFPAPTVAAVNGHAFGAGAMLVLVHDFRLMRADRGFFCLPEVDLKMPLHPGMAAILNARMPGQALQEAVVTGKRWGGAEAKERGIVEEAPVELDLLPRALAIAAPLASKADPVLRTLKRNLHPQVLEAIRRRLVP